MKTNSHLPNPMLPKPAGAPRRARSNALLSPLHRLRRSLRLRLPLLRPSSSAAASLRTLANSSFRLEQDDFIQLAPVGLFPHSKGFQHVDRPAIDKLLKNFDGFFARLGRRFAGVPIYVGHPDVRGMENLYPDRKAYGWIMELQARDDGLYGRPKWSSAGHDMIANAHFKFLSPCWHAEPAGTVEGRPAFRPIELLSVGLTNEPNLPVLPLANANANAISDPLPETCVGSSLPLGASASSEPEAPSPRETTGESPAEQPASALPVNPTQALVNSSSPSAVPGLESLLSGPLARCQEQIALLNERLENVVLDQAIATARIFPAERPQWQAALREDFSSAHARLANARPRLNLVSCVDQLPRRPGAPASGEDRQRRLLALVNDKMRATGLDYHEAWIQLRAENTELF